MIANKRKLDISESSIVEGGACSGVGVSAGFGEDG